MALSTTDRGCPDGRLGCRHLGQQEEEGPRPREAAVYHFDRRSCNKRPRPQRGNNGSCHMHPNSRHSAAECREIIELAKRVSEGASNLPRMIPRLVVGLARRGLTTARWPRENRTSGISHPRGS
jgi:hypothetical protein